MQGVGQMLALRAARLRQSVRGGRGCVARR